MTADDPLRMIDDGGVNEDTDVVDPTDAELDALDADYGDSEADLIARAEALIAEEREQ